MKSTVSIEAVLPLLKILGMDTTELEEAASVMDHLKSVPAAQMEETFKRHGLKNALTVQEAYDQIIEGTVSMFKFRDMLRKGQIPSVRIGSRYILRRDTLEAWMREQEKMNFKQQSTR